MRGRLIRRAIGLALCCGLSVTGCATSGSGSPTRAAAPSPTATGAPTAPVSAAAREAEIAEGLPSLRPSGSTWKVAGAEAVGRFLQQQVGMLSVGKNDVVIVPIAASPALAGFRLRVSTAGSPRTSRTLWFSLPGGALLDNADLVTPDGSVPTGGLAFTPAGDLYWETPRGTGWGPHTAPAPGSLSRLGMLARAAAVDPLDPLSDPPANCSAVNCVALTFDDGPGPGTAGLLRTLTQNAGRATFFVNGVHVAGNEPLLWAMVGAGNELGNHNQTHVRLSPLPDAEVASGVAATDALIASMRGSGARVFRPPYGDFDEAVRGIVGAQGYSMVLWNLDPLDYRTTDPALIAQRVLASVRPGSVILSHDTLPSTEVAYRTIIPELRARGYRLVTVDELLGPGAAGQVRGGY